MSDTSEGLGPTSEISLSMLPTEIFFILFEFVPPKDMIRCRQVCVRWREVIDAILRDGSLWEWFCKRDYKKVYKQAMWKTPNITNWFEIYRSLSLWSQLLNAKETIDEFCHSDTIDEEMRSAIVQECGIIMVHKRTKVVYYDLMTLEVARRKGSAGQYVSLQEFRDVVVMLGMNGQLHVVNKPNPDWNSDLNINTNEDNEIVFNDVKCFIVENRTIFYSTYRHDLYSFHLDNDKLANHIEIPNQLLDGIPDGIGAVGFSNDCLYILTMSENMYMYVNTHVYFKFNLSSVTNLMDCLYQHNMLEDLDWRNYYILMAHLKHKRHTGLLQFICKMQIYGDDLFFVGTQSGIVNIYYKPLINGQLDLTQVKPIKVYNFSARIDIPILSVYPIINIEVTETKDGHKILVCMPRKILVITYRHEFEKPVSKAVVPYVHMPVFSI